MNLPVLQYQSNEILARMFGFVKGFFHSLVMSLDMSRLVLGHGKGVCLCSHLGLGRQTVYRVKIAGLYLWEEGGEWVWLHDWGWCGP